MTRARMFSMLGATLLLSACAKTIPQELSDARRAYQQAMAGPAAEVKPAELHKAHESLVIAERAFADDPKSQHTRDLAYVAQRKAMLADALARQEVDLRNKE